MPAKETLRRNKTKIQAVLCGDHSFILDKVYEKNLITPREYNNLKSINKEDVEGHVIKLMDKIMNKGEETCQDFLSLLETDEDVKTTYPVLKLNDTSLLRKPVQASSAVDSDVLPQGSKRRKENKQYELKSQPTGICVIINNENFKFSKTRSGTDKDAESLAEVFSWLGFRVLMCKDQTRDQMDRALKCFASQSDVSQLQEFSVKEWSDNGFTDLQEAPKHGDAFICCILSHGDKGEVFGSDDQPLSIKQITATFKATEKSPLKGKPKVFLIQACQGKLTQRGVLLTDLQTDDTHSTVIPEEADFLAAIATVEDHVSFRHTRDGSWFVQSLCQQMKERCPGGEEIRTILDNVNDEVGEKEASRKPGEAKQMPVVWYTLRGSLVFSPRHI